MHCRSTRRVAGAAAGIVAAALPLAACSTSGGEAADTITFFNGQHVQTTDALVKAFDQETGITVKVHTDDESVLADQIVTEGSRSPADVVFTENTPTPPADVPGSNPRDEWITQIHRDTSALVVDAIGEAKMRELRAQGEAMDHDQALACARTHIAEHLATLSHEVTSRPGTGSATELRPPRRWSRSRASNFALFASG
jgi:hypothetical protein